MTVLIILLDNQGLNNNTIIYNLATMKRRDIDRDSIEEERRRKQKEEAKRGIGIAGLSGEALAVICITAVHHSRILLPPSLMMENQKRKVEKGKVIHRTRRAVPSVMYELGPELTRRYFRMTKETFYSLLKMLDPKISNSVVDDNMQDDERSTATGATQGTQTSSTYKGAPNGIISKEIRLAVALRYFAGGAALDIALVFGINHSDVFKSVWIIVDAINRTTLMDIEYPEKHETQRQIALDFKQNSAVGFDCCAGAIDGMIVWIHRPSSVECDEMGFGPKKFYCGRKKKFALNLQGVCDAKRRFIDICVRHPGSTSDFLCFQTSSLYHKLERPSFLSEGLALFGDNAYVSNRYMVTPFRAVSSGPKDAFNYYQSQVRIAVECAFGILVHKWGILRKAIPMNISIKKTCALVSALCKLHNFCIDSMDDISGQTATGAQDELNIAASGGIPLDRSQENPYRPSQLLDGNERATEDYDRAVIAREHRIARNGILVRDGLLRLVEENNYQRVVPSNWMTNR